MKVLYYIDSINKEETFEDNREDSLGIKYMVRLENVARLYELYEKQDMFVDSNHDEYDRSILTLQDIPEAACQLADSGSTVYEGMFVYYDAHEGQYGKFYAGWRDPLAQMLIAKGREARRNLREKSNNFQLERLFDDTWMNNSDTEVCSYHVNVGHGNCSLILWKNSTDYRLWMVDCGHSCISSSVANADIDAAFMDIENKCQQPVYVHRFMLTHWHDDHFCDISYLISKGWINSDTDFVMNLYYQCSSPNAVPLLQLLDKMNVKCYEPLVQHSTKIMHVLYPDRRIVRWPSSSGDDIVEKTINNSSIVYSIFGAGKSIVFPGDLGKKGFDRMTASTTCRADLFDATYYCVSHHASKTGHVDFVCKGFGPCPNVFGCVLSNLKYAIVMGKDGAYSGIYSQKVINAVWPQPLLYSEYDSTHRTVKALRIEWVSGLVQYLY